MTEKKKLKIMSLSVEPEMHELLKESAKIKGWSTSQLMRELVDRYLDLIVPKNGTDETTGVVLRIPGKLKDDQEALTEWMNVKSNCIISALCKKSE